MTVLLLDNFLNTRYSRYFSRYHCKDMIVHRPPDGDFPEEVDGYSHVILSGSEGSIVNDRHWVDTEMELVRQLARKKIPTLGICFGHQLIARALLGDAGVRHSKTPEIGWKSISVTRQDDLFAGMERKFHIFVSHFDEIADLTDDFEVLASTDRCACHAFKLKDAPMWGLQFHPEIDMESGKTFMEDTRSMWNGWDVDPDAEMENARDSGISGKLFRNFYAVKRK